MREKRAMFKNVSRAPRQLRRYPPGSEMDIAGTGKRVRIYIGEQDRAEGHHEPLWETLLGLLRQEGAAGATLFRGLAGFGAHHKLHAARFAELASHLPLVIEWLDGPERVERLLPRLCELVPEGTITVEDVDVVKYTHREPLRVPADPVGEGMTRGPGGVLIGGLGGVDLLRTMGEDYPSTESAGSPESAESAGSAESGGSAEADAAPLGPGARVVAEVMRRDVPAVRADAPLGEVLD